MYLSLINTLLNLISVSSQKRFLLFLIHLILLLQETIMMEIEGFQNWTEAQELGTT